MRDRLNVVVLSFVAMGAVACGSEQELAQGSEPLNVGGLRILATRMTGAQEAPGPGDADGSGSALILLNQRRGQVCFALSAVNILLPATAAHIHVGPPGAPGPIVVPLMPAPNERGFSAGCVEAAADLIENIGENPEQYYVNVHNADFPAGAIRGQLAR